MDKNYANEDFLVRWMAGELNQKELEGFQASDVYRQLMFIDKVAEGLNGPEIDVEQALSVVLAKTKEEKKDSKVRQLWWLPAIAASIALLFGVYSYFFGIKTYATGIGETETVLLADGSIIEMNANSKLSLKRFGWMEDKAVEFEGEGFFDVQSGADFTVRTNKGSIAVLGTKFNVRNRKNLKVQCYEGSIVFTPLDPSRPITKLGEGSALELTDSEYLESQLYTNRPEWTEGFSSFTQQPFDDVLEELAIQYPVTIQSDSVETNRLFTGKFTHNDLESALKTTLEPMGIKYLISEDKRIVTLSK